jgi:hypothetical protein
MPSRQDIVTFDLATASVDLDPVPLDEILDYRRQYAAEHRDYIVNLRRFVGEIADVDGADRRRLLDQRQAALNDQAKSLRRLALDAFKRPKNVAGFSLGLTGSAWTLATGDPVPAGLAALGLVLGLMPARDAGSAYSYIFRAHRLWG